MADHVNGMAVEYVGIDTIAPAPWNVRTGHDVEGIAESIVTNGFRDPIEVWRDTGEIVRGNGTWKAAKLLGLDRVPIIRHDFADLAAAKRYAIAHNRLGEKSEWDWPALDAQLEELEDLAGTGFDPLPPPDDPPTTRNDEQAEQADESEDAQVCFRVVVPAAEADEFGDALAAFAEAYEWAEVTRRA